MESKNGAGGKWDLRACVLRGGWSITCPQWVLHSPSSAAAAAGARVLPTPTVAHKTAAAKDYFGVPGIAVLLGHRLCREWEWGEVIPANLMPSVYAPLTHP